MPYIRVFEGKKDCSWVPLNKHAMNNWLSSLRIKAHTSWRKGKHLHVLHLLRTYSTCSYPGYQDTTTYAALYHAIPCNTMQHHAIPCKTMPYHAIPCNIMQYHAIPCNTMQNHAIPCKTMPYHAIPCNIMQCHAIPCNTLQYPAIPCNTMQYHAIPCNTMQYHAIPCMLNNCWRSVPLPCGQYMAIFSVIWFKLDKLFCRLFLLAALDCCRLKKGWDEVGRKLRRPVGTRDGDQGVEYPAGVIKSGLRWTAVGTEKCRNHGIDK